MVHLLGDMYMDITIGHYHAYTTAVIDEQCVYSERQRWLGALWRGFYTCCAPYLIGLVQYSLDRCDDINASHYDTVLERMQRVLFRMGLTIPC